MKKTKKYTLLILFLLTTEYIFANAGSTMLWFSFLHLIVINGIIGMFESSILSVIFKIKNKMVWIIVGNYISMFIGMYLIAPYFASLAGNKDFFGNWTYNQVGHLSGFFIGMLCAFITTLIVEFPFYRLAIAKEYRPQTIKELLISNFITYGGMTLIYYFFVK